MKKFKFGYKKDSGIIFEGIGKKGIRYGGLGAEAGWQRVADPLKH